MLRVRAIADFLEAFAPSCLAEDWDNVGLLVGDADAAVERIMTCLSVTDASADEAIRQRAELIVAHHPIPFQPLKRLTTESPTGRLLLRLVADGVAVYSPHTALDSAARGINQLLAEGLGLHDIAPLVTAPGGISAGRCGRLRAVQPLGEFAETVKAFLRLEAVQRVGDAARPIQRVAVACGSATELLSAARERGCDCFVTGEARFHSCLEAEATGMAMLLVGHHASERFGVERLAEALAEKFADATVWASRDEHDPIAWT